LLLWLWVRWCGLSTMKLQFAMRKCQVVVECGISGKVDWTSKATGSNSNGFVALRTLEGVRYAVSRRII
jgi:hypothetical protein